MKKELVGALGLLLASAGLCLAQGVASPPIGLARYSTTPADSPYNPQQVVTVQAKDEPKAPAPMQPAAPVASPLASPSCMDCCLTCPEQCTAGERVWFNADYLLWWVKKGPKPPLVVTGPETDPFPGALDQPNTVVLYGNNRLRYDTFNGVRLEAGAWLNQDRRWGVEVSWFTLEKRSADYSAAGDGNGQPFIARPFVNALSGNQNVYFVSQNFADPALAAKHDWKRLRL